MKEKIAVDDGQLEQVTGGLLQFHKISKALTYIHEDGSVSEHRILDYEKAWNLCCSLEAQNWTGDRIFQDLLSKGYVAE